MTVKPAERRKTQPRRPSREIEESAAAERSRIRKSMNKWEGLDEVGRLLGRSLGKKELVGRVAQEVGVSVRQVNSALR